MVCSQLEMERALLEGEHKVEMDQLQGDQERINSLKRKQLHLIELATTEREKVCVSVVLLHRLPLSVRGFCNNSATNFFDNKYTWFYYLCTRHCSNSAVTKCKDIRVYIV